MIIRKRRARVRDMMLKGVVHQDQMAARLGVCQATISKDIKWIFDTWLKDDIRTAKDKRNRRVRQLEMVVQMAIVSFERSRQDAEEITLTKVPRRCPDCKGSGMNGDDNWCETCNGDGTIYAETETRRVKGQAGDSSFLGKFTEAVREMARIENLYPRGGAAARKIEGRVLHAHIGLGNLDLDKAPAELILNVKEAYSRLENSVKGKNDGKENEAIEKGPTDEPPSASD